MGNGSVLKKYRNAISDFEKYREKIYSHKNLKGNEYKGYLINLKDYERIKQNFDNIKINKKNDFKRNFNINQIEFKTSHFLINMILNGNKYIFINTELWKLICDKDKADESPIIYKVNSNDITFYIDNKYLTFKHNKNIIDKSMYKDNHYKSQYEQIRRICDSTINYYNFENKILNDLKNKQCSYDIEYELLISQNWIDKWKKISNYESIKANYLKNNINNKDNMINDLIYHLEKNKLDYNELFRSINVRKYNKKEEIEFYLKKDSLVLIDYKFLVNFEINYSNKLSKYKAFNNKIHIYLDNEILSFISNNNTISINGIINYSNLKQLIKIFYFQKKVKSSTIKEKNNINKFYLINKKVINTYKNAFNYKQLYDFLMSNSKTQNINYDYLEINDYYKVVNEFVNNDFIEQFIQIEESKIITEFKDNEIFKELVYKINSPSEKNLKYIINFEIVDKDIKEFFIKSNIAKEEHFISLYSFKADNGKILIIFDKDNKNFYEIGHLNDNEDFIIEYLIDELENKNKYSIVDYFFKYTVSFLIKNEFKESQNIINLSTNWTKSNCFYYKIEENEKTEKIESNLTLNGNNINNNNVDIINNKFVKNIFSILLSIFIFERNIFKSSNQLDKSNILLLSNQFLSEFKNLFFYDKVYSILEKLNLSSNFTIEEEFKKFSGLEESENIFRLISNNEKEIEKYKDKNKNYFIFAKNSFNNNSYQSALYPDKFCILDENIYSNINKLLNIDIESIEEIQFELFFNYGKLVLKPKSFSKFNYKYYIFIYSLLKNDSRKDVNYIPEIILSFENSVKMNNSFEEILKNENIFETCSLNNFNFENKYKCKSYLINKNNKEDLNKNKNIELNANNNKLNKYLSYLIIIYSEYSKITKEINEEFIVQLNMTEKEDKEYYLINRNYMKDLEDKLNLNEFINQIKIDEINNLDLDINNINNDIINKIKGNLEEKFVNYLITLDENNLIINNENKYDISTIELNDNENKKIYYYNNCQIINKKLYLLLNKIDKDLSKRTISIRCILNNNKIIIFSNDKIINVGSLNEEKIFVIEYIFYSELSEDISQIFEIIKVKGYSFIEKYLTNKKIEIAVNNKLIEAKIYSLLGEKETNKNRKDLSQKLKTLILLSLIKNKKINYHKSNNIEKVFLMNKEWLFQYKYEEINKLIEKNDKIKDYLNKGDISNLSFDSIQMKEIISLLDYESLLTIDDNISKIQNINGIPCQAKTELLKLGNKNIIIYTNFILINEKISQMFRQNFESFKCEYNEYLSHMDGDIIIVNKYSSNLILFGKIKSMDYSFDIKFIIDFKYEYLLKKELEILMNNKINEYIKNKTLLNENGLNKISPLFDNDNIIGYCYKYNSNNNYFYINYDNLLKAINLYFYYQEFSKKIQESKSNETELYLINSNLMSEIKINYKYKQIKEILDTKIFLDKNNKIILAIKSLSNDIINYFKENIDIKNKYENDFMGPDIIPFKEGKNSMIYDKFELLEREKAQDLINGIYGRENNYLKCSINEGKIIIHYPENFNGNNKYISVIGQLNYENHFINEYILIYNDLSSKFGHLYNIKGNLNNYLSALQLYENSAPITDKDYKEIGTIIKCSNETFNYNSNNETININEIKNNFTNNSIKETSNDTPQYLKIDENEKNKIIDYNKSNNNADEYNLDYQTDSHEIRVNFIYPPKIGLQNIGATCYMNATLQCFCHIEKFVNYFKYNQHIISMVRNNKNNLTSSFKLLIEKLWPNNYNEFYPQKYYAPEEFKNKISKLNPLFEGIAANDAKDLVNFIIMTLHQELNKSQKKIINNNNIFLDQRNQQIMFNNFAQHFTSENQSIVSDLFYGINCNITLCCNCNTNIYNYQIYFFLVFPLEEVRKFKNNNFLNNPVNIYDCFDYDRKVNFMYGENSMYCNYCKQNSTCKMCTNLITGPEILILLLNRGQGIEFNVKINFFEELNLSNYIQMKNTGFKYKLIGVITHIGESGMGGHFIAYCKDPISQSWNKYNDAIVSEVQDKDFQREVINFAMPYLLFYQKTS